MRLLFTNSVIQYGQMTATFAEDWAGSPSESGLAVLIQTLLTNRLPC